MAEERKCGWMQRLNCPVIFKDAFSQKQGTLPDPCGEVRPYL